MANFFKMVTEKKKSKDTTAKKNDNTKNTKNTKNTLNNIFGTSRNIIGSKGCRTK